MKTALNRAYGMAAGAWNAILGIYVELLLTAVIVVACFLVCFFWWAIAQ